MVETIEQFLGRLIPQVVNAWFKLIANDPYTEVYICFRLGDVIAATEAPDGYELHPVRLMPNLSRQQCTNFVREQIRRLPILPPSPTLGTWQMPPAGQGRSQGLWAAGYYDAKQLKQVVAATGLTPEAALRNASTLVIS